MRGFFTLVNSIFRISMCTIASSHLEMRTPPTYTLCYTIPLEYSNKKKCRVRILQPYSILRLKNPSSYYMKKNMLWHSFIGYNHGFYQ